MGAADGSRLVHAADPGLARRWRDELAAAGLGALALVPADGPQAFGELPVRRRPGRGRGQGVRPTGRARWAGGGRAAAHRAAHRCRDGVVRHAAGRRPAARPDHPHPARRPVGRARGGPAAGRAVHRRRGGAARRGPAPGPGAERGGRARQGGHVGLPRPGLRPRRPRTGRPRAGGGRGARPGGPARRLRSPRGTRRRLVRGPDAAERAAGGRRGQDPAERRLPGGGRQRGDRRPGRRLAGRAGSGHGARGRPGVRGGTAGGGRTGRSRPGRSGRGGRSPGARRGGVAAARGDPPGQ